MRSRISFHFALLAIAVLLLGCDDTHPLDPTLAPSSPRDAVVSDSRLAAPSNTAAVAPSESEIDVSWQDNSTTESGFEVHRSDSQAGTFTLRATVNADAVTYRDVGLAPSAPYCYRTRAKRVTGAKTTYSEFSNTACAKTMAQLYSASEAAAVALDSSTVRVTWRDNASGEDGFRVYRSTDSGVSWDLAATTTDVVFVDSGVRNAELAVCYRVVVFDSTREAAPSNASCTTPPAAPTNLTRTVIDDQTLELRWNDNSAVEDSYEVWVEYSWGPPCGPGACNAVLYTDDYMVVALPANSTSYRCSCTGGALWVYATKDGYKVSSDWR